MAKTVADLSPAVASMQADWTLAAALMGGTRAMRAAGEALLPKWPNEEKKAYDARLATATLYPAYLHTVETLTGKPFSKPITLGEDVPTDIRKWCDDIDQEGRSLHVFASDLMESALGEGLCGILVDYPEAGNVRTAAEEQQLGLRPYMVHIKPGQLRGFVAARVLGKWVLQQLRFLETVQEPDGQFGTAEVPQIRVLYPGRWETWRKPAGKEDWTLHDGGITTLPYIPFVPIYGKRTGFMMGKPPMLELAHLNVKHWQSQSDQDTLLHIARVPILVRTNVGETVGPDGAISRPALVIGAGVAIDLPKDGTLTYTEHTGAAIDAGKTALDDLKEEMRQSGAEMLVLKPGNSTRIEAASDNVKGMCALQRVTLGLQDGLNTALQYMAEWVKQPTGGHVAIFNDFGAATLEEADLQILLGMNQAGILSRETTFKEGQRRGTISADVDFEEEQERISQEGPALGTMDEDTVPGGAGGA